VTEDPILEASRKALVAEPEKVEIRVVDYDPAWVDRFDTEAARVRSALGDDALMVEHIGSTSVPGLAAKPIIDICVVVADSSDESSYVPALEATGYELRVREPDWHEHRMLRTPARDVHVHVLTQGSTEIRRYLAFATASAGTQRTEPCVFHKSVCTAEPWSNGMMPRSMHSGFR
jgi:GrpB-like predicted nucleotidyltransferase (UPF0157 family)